jgi:twitching motility protein PilT
MSDQTHVPMNRPEDLDALVNELNAEAPRPATVGDDAQTVRLRGWLEYVVERNASDLLLVAGAPPSIRVDGVITPLHEGPLGSDEIGDAVGPALPPHARKAFRDAGIADGSFRVPDLGRFRINLHHERGRAAAAIRRLPSAVPRFASLGLPAGVEALTRLPRGLVLVGGPTGSGKTTTLAALVNEINLRDAKHIITIEDPIEYEHQHRRSVVEQVEIGIDAPDFPTALRQAPDVIVVGEMRDPETMQIAVTAGETGHLVFSSLHTTDVATTIARIADSFPLERQNTIRQELAMALAAVMTQTLMPRVTPSGFAGLIPAAELLMVGYGARQHVRKNALHHLHQEITITRKQGSFTLEESLTDLVGRGLIDRKDAITRAVHPEELERLLS